MFHLNYSKGLEKSSVWNAWEVWRVSLAQGEIPSETEMEGEGRRIFMGEEENSKAVELLWSNTLKTMERFFVAPFFVFPCRKHINIKLITQDKKGKRQITFSYLYKMSTDIFLPYVEVSPIQCFTGKKKTLLLITPDTAQRSSSGTKPKETHTELYS